MKVELKLDKISEDKIKMAVKGLLNDSDSRRRGGLEAGIIRLKGLAGEVIPRKTGHLQRSGKIELVGAKLAELVYRAKYAAAVHEMGADGRAINWTNAANRSVKPQWLLTTVKEKKKEILEAVQRRMKF